MTLENFLSQPLTANFKLLTDDIAISEIPVEYISTLEPPVESFVRHNEIILSTAISVRDNPYSLLQFIKDLKNAGASALVIAHPRNNHKILESIIPEINAIRFPVITANWDVLFSKVVEETIKLIWENEALSHSLMEQVQNDLLHLFIQGKTLDDAAQLLSEKIQSDVLILDYNHNPVGRNARIRALSPYGYLESRQTDLARIVISSFEKIYGYLIIDSAIYAEKINESSFIQYITVPLALWFDREHTNLSAKMKAKEEFVWKLVQNDFETHDEIEQMAIKLNIPTNLSYACLIGNIDFENYSSNFDYLHHSTKSVISELIAEITSRLDLAVMTTQNQKQLLIFLECKDNKLFQNVANDFITELERALHSTVPSLQFLWGYDAQAYSISELDKGYSNALKALDSCILSEGKITRSCYQVSILKRMLLSVRNDTACLSFAENKLMPLIKYDSAKNTDFMNTLKTYCECNYNVSLASRETHLHRQSFLYRLEKIEELCDFSISSHEDLLLIELCMRIIEQSK